MYLDSLMKRTGAKGAQRIQCMVEGDEICRYQLELNEGNGALERKQAEDSRAGRFLSSTGTLVTSK
jgi:hypothetical protein